MPPEKQEFDPDLFSEVITDALETNHDRGHCREECPYCGIEREEREEREAKEEEDYIGCPAQSLDG